MRQESYNIIMESAQSWLTWLNHTIFRQREHPQTPAPDVLITAHINTSRLSKSQPLTFAITLQATTDTSSPITINPHRTILEPGTLGVAGSALGFRDTATGKLAQLNEVDVQYLIPEYLHANATVEIPPLGAEKPFAVTHRFVDPPGLEECEAFARQVEQMSAEEGEEEAGAKTAGEEMQELLSQVGGLQVGSSYEIVLRENAWCVSWWRHGRKEDVFGADQRLRRRGGADGPGLGMRLTNAVAFEVVD